MPVYAIQMSDDGPVKLGFAGNPVSRLRGLQTGSPYKLNLIAIIPGDLDTESELRTRFIGCLISGEWHRPTPDLMAFCAEYRCPPPEPRRIAGTCMNDTAIIDAIGVATLVRELPSRTGQPLDREAVYKWRERDRIAHHWRPWVVALARDTGIDVPDAPPPPVRGKAA